MHKILIVDDEVTVERLIVQRFRKEIDENNYSFTFAENGVEALNKLKQKEFDMVISDINMPEMDGITLLEHIQEVDPVIKTIMVSAYDDFKNIRGAMNRGAFDFLTKPIDFKDLKATINKTLKHVDSIRRSLNLIDENSVLRQYVNPSIFAHFNKRDENLRKEGTYRTVSSYSERINASVVFIDLCSFTSLSEKFPPESIIELLNKYFDIAAEAINRHGGVVDKFIGDAVLAFFKDGDFVRRSVQATTEILAAVRTLAQGEWQPGTRYPQVSAGINCGKMILGNYGSPKIGRLDYSIIGDVVNSAAAIEYHAPAGNVYVHKNVAEAIAGGFKTESLGHFNLKTRSEGVELFRIV